MTTIPTVTKTANTSAATTQADQKFPTMPVLKSLSAEDQTALENWHYQMKQVIIRQNQQLAAAIDTKANKA